MRVRFTENALADLRGIDDYLVTRDPAAARRVLSAIMHSIERLTYFPYSGRAGEVAGTRELVVPTFPYIVIYEVQAEAVAILAVMHAAMNRKPYEK